MLVEWLGPHLQDVVRKAQSVRQRSGCLLVVDFMVTAVKFLVAAVIVYIVVVGVLILTLQGGSGSG